MTTELTHNLARPAPTRQHHRLPLLPILARTVPFLIAAVWIYHGLYNKLLGAEPRHLLIVQSVPGLGGTVGVVLLFLIGLAELAIAFWIISGRSPRACAAVQTIALLAMNIAELTWARHHLLFPAALIPVNLAFLTLVWITAQLQHRHRLRIGRHLLQRHPFPVRARFRHCLVLTYAFPREVLEPLLPPGLELDTHNNLGFVAAAFVQTHDLRPAFLPQSLGQDFFLTGYRIFVKFRTPDGRTLRGLRILRSDADHWPMVLGGNLLTHYHYHKSTAALEETDDRLTIRIHTPHARADVDLTADLSPSADITLPPGSPFTSPRDARRFAGPLPWTFDYEPQTHSIIAIKGIRQNWSPRMVPVNVRRLNFLDQSPFAARGILASAFHLHDIPYHWNRGIRHQLPQQPESHHKPAARFQGTLQILRFNWPQYLTGAIAVLLAIAATLLFNLPTPAAALLLLGTALAVFWLIASILVSHWIYDRSPLRSWRWIAPALGFIPRRWINLHAGLDESTNTLQYLFPHAEGRAFDFYDHREMSEPSIRRARQRATGAPVPEHVRYDALPLPDHACDAALLLLSAHELRRHASRLAFLREFHRILQPHGRIVLAEHLRDLPNFIAFGPGAFHFHSRRTWRRAIREAGLAIDREFRITPFITVFILHNRRPS